MSGAPGVVTVDVSGLAPGQTRAVEAGGAQLLVCNAGGRFFALENRCPHAAVRLDGGTLRGFVLECAVHGGRLDVRDGSPAGGPIRRCAVTYPVREGTGWIEIDLGGPRAGKESSPCTTS